MTSRKPSTLVYAMTFGGLLALTLLTSLLGLVDLGRLTLALAVLIAATKAALIAGFFMHAFYGTRLVRVAVIVGIVWLGFLLTLTLGDYLTRGWLLPSGK